MANFISDIANGSSRMVIKWLAMLFLGIAFTRDRLIHLARRNVWVPLNFALLRPHWTMKTLYGIKCAAGGLSGWTFTGHSNMQIEHEAARKVGMMHYTVYLNAQVTNDRYVYTQEDMYSAKYMGGGGISFWTTQEYKNTLTGGSRTRHSIICIPLPPNQEPLDSVFDIRGKWYTEQRIGLVSPEQFLKTHYAGATRMNRILGWYDPIRRGKGLDQSAYRHRAVAMNYIVWQGVQWKYNTTTDRFDDVIVEQSPFGPKVYPGCGRVRNGELQYLKDPGYLNLVD